MEMKQFPFMMIISSILLLLPLVVSWSVLPVQRLVLQNQPVLDNITHPKKFFSDTPFFPLEGSHNRGFYTTKVRLGTPAREFNVIIDTGSFDLWVSCKECIGCPHSSDGRTPVNIFDPDSSSTASSLPCKDKICSHCSENKQCTYTTTYGGGTSTSGYYVKDLLSFNVVLDGSNLAANSSVPFVFGCSTSCLGYLSTLGIDGIMGFGHERSSFVSQMSSLHKAPQVFSHCFNGDGRGGVLVFGEISYPPIVYSPLAHSKPHYIISLESISAEEQQFSIGRKRQGAIIDSGTRYGVLVDQIYDSLTSVIDAAVSKYATQTGKQCYHVFNSSIKIFPRLSFNFKGGPTIVLKPDDYLLLNGFEGDAVVWCHVFLRSSSITILGDVFLQNKLVVYDFPRKRIGLANHNCSLPVHIDLQASRSTSKYSTSLINVLHLCILPLVWIMHLI